MVHVSKRDRARKMRKEGRTYPEIGKVLDVSKSTLNYWFRDIVLDAAASQRILERKRKALVETRKKAVLAKEKVRLQEEALADKEMRELLAKDDRVAVLAALFGGLYLGEGFKVKSYIGFANSNVDILVLFVSLLRTLFHPEERRLRCFLFLRLDQSEQLEKVYWSNKLAIPLDQFRKTQFDKRTLGKKTYSDYHGVCAVYCYDAKIEKKVSALQRYILQMPATGV